MLIQIGWIDVDDWRLQVQRMPAEQMNQTWIESPKRMGLSLYLWGQENNKIWDLWPCYAILGSRIRKGRAHWIMPISKAGDGKMWHKEWIVTILWRGPKHFFLSMIACNRLWSRFGSSVRQVTHTWYSCLRLQTLMVQSSTGVVQWCILKFLRLNRHEATPWDT